jgi:hypothetical protein
MIMLKEARMMIVRNGELMLMEEATTMPDGTRVLPDGTVLLTDGTTRRMVEGETLRLVEVAVDTNDIPEMGSTEEMTGTETHDPT